MHPDCVELLEKAVDDDGHLLDAAVRVQGPEAPGGVVVGKEERVQEAAGGVDDGPVVGVGNGKVEHHLGL